MKILRFIRLGILLFFVGISFSCGGGGGASDTPGVTKAETITRYVQASCPNGVTTYNPEMHSCTGGTYTVHTTIQNAADVVNPGDTVIVTDGTYTDTDGNNRIVNLTRGGTSSAWITFKAENKWGAVLDGQVNTTGYGFVINNSVQYVKIQDFEIKGVNNTAIFSNPLTADSATGFIEVYRNKIHDIARMLIYCDNGQEQYGHTAVYGSIYTHDWVVDSNIAWNVGRLQGGCPTSNEYAHDHFVYTGHAGSTATTHTYNWDIINNIVYEGDNHMAGFFVALGQYGENINIVNNTVRGHNYKSTVYGVIYMNQGLKNLNIQNNIFYDTPVGFLHNLDARTPTGVTIYNNLTTAPNVFGYSTTPATVSGNILSTDPLFISLSNNDYHLQSTSPAIDSGLHPNAPLVDFAGVARGNPPEIGAYEFVSTYVPLPQ